MKFFSALYNKTLKWSLHPHARYYLAGVSFAESSFFPIPPDVMLLAMGLAKPTQAWTLAFITTLFSVLGGIFGYMIGMFGIEFIMPYIQHSSWNVPYIQAVSWFGIYGVWTVFLAGFSPIPYKVFTIAAGALHMPFAFFILASMAGRGLRFYLVATLLYFFGEKIDGHLRIYIDVIGWTLLVLVVILLAVLRPWSG